VELEKYINLGGCTSWGPEYVSVHAQTLSKTASACYTPDSLVQVMAKLTPRPEGRYILLNALGAYEYWGVNMNGDAFPEWSLKGEPPPKSVQDIIELKVLPKIPTFVTPTGRYGHKTFVDFAKVYVGHANTDPTKSIGDVIASDYNEKMRRVELIVFVYKDRNPELIQKIDSGEPVPFSMGAKLSFDVCSVCLNIARTRGEYCEHLTNLLRQTLPDGRKVFSYNFFPRFFDISYVRVPADRSAWALRKVASVADSVAVLPAKRYFDKLSELIKEEPAAAKSLGTTPINPELVRLITDKANAEYTSCEEDPALLEAVKNHKLSKVLATLTAMGVLLRPAEVVKLSSGHTEEFPKQFNFSDVDRLVMKDITNIIPTRSLHNPYFIKRAHMTHTSRGSVDTDSAEFTQYREYLKSIDFKKLAEWVDKSPMAKVTLQLDDFLLKLAGLSVKSPVIPIWLPFVSTVLRFNSNT